MDNIYRNKLLKFPLEENEYKEIQKVWDFLDFFKKDYVFFTDHRDYIIKSVQDNYSPNEFLFYENIANKLFWNLRWLLFPLFINQNINEKEYNKIIEDNYDDYLEIPNCLILSKKINYENSEDMANKIREESLLNNYYRSFINKLIMVDKTKKIIHVKEMEGSSEIFSKNYFNLYTMSILFDKELYEEIMKNPFLIKNKKLQLPNYYHQMDYGFPNLNTCAFSIGSNEEKINRILKMYYDASKSPKYWFKIIY